MLTQYVFTDIRGKCWK